MNASNLSRLLFIGDSICVQYLPYLKPILADRFVCESKQGKGDALADLDVPQGSSAGDSRMVLDYLSAINDEGRLSADFMVLNCGLHDIKIADGMDQCQVSQDNYRANLHAIVALVHNAGIPLVWTRTTPSVDAIHNRGPKPFKRYASDNDAYCAIADKVMAEHNVPSIDLRGFTQSLGGDEIYNDHVHFKPQIRQLQAAFIAGSVLAYTTTLKG